MPEPQKRKEQEKKRRAPERAMAKEEGALATGAPPSDREMTARPGAGEMRDEDLDRKTGGGSG